MVQALDIVAAIGIVVLAAACVLDRGRLRPVVLFVVFGMVMSLLWIRLGAPDLAIAEAAIGAGLVGALLMAAVVSEARSTSDHATGRSARRATAWLGGLLALVVSIALVAALRDASPASGGTAAAVPDAVAESGIAHPVTAVLLSLRAWDTLLELAVLMAAVIGAGLALRSAGGPARGEASHGVTQHGDPVREATSDGADSRQLAPWLATQVVPLLVVAGIALLAVGAYGPGGEFQAGAVLAAALVLLRIAGIVEIERVPDLVLRAGVVIGVAAFATAGLVSAAGNAAMLTWRGDAAEVWVLVIEVTATVGIAIALALLHAACSPARPLPSRRDADAREVGP